MRLRNHRLVADDGSPVRFESSPNRSGQLDPTHLIVHYTAGSSAESAIRTLCNPANKASAHLVIARDGAVTQLVPFNRVAWHAGRSRWRGLVGLNRHAIGIELDNAGKLTRQSGVWKSWFGRTYADEDVLEATHKNETEPCGWHTYTEAQLQRTIDVARLLAGRYPIRDVLGHDDIAPGRKQDPGPAFPMESVASSVLGRQDDAPELYMTRTRLNVRSGPGTDFDKVVATPLSPGTRLDVKSRDRSWCFVDVLDADGAPDLTGWVHGDYIEPV